MLCDCQSTTPHYPASSKLLYWELQPTFGSLFTLGTLKAANVAALVVVLVAEMARRVDCPIRDAEEALRPIDAMREALRSWEFNSPEARVEDMVDSYAK